MSGYMEENDNQGAFTDDGFFRTGDIGRFDSNGYLYVTGRKKHILVLSTGKKVSPEPIEVKLVDRLPISGAVLLGDQQPFTAAALFIDKEHLEELNHDHQQEALESFLRAEIQEKLSELSDYERPKKIFIVQGTLEDYPDILTPTMKVKREVFAKLFAEQIAKVYRKAA